MCSSDLLDDAVVEEVPVQEPPATALQEEPQPPLMAAAPVERSRPLEEPDTAPTRVDTESVASSQWQDGIALSPMLVGSLVVVALVAAVATFLVLSIVAG